MYNGTQQYNNESNKNGNCHGGEVGATVVWVWLDDWAGLDGGLVLMMCLVGR